MTLKTRLYAYVIAIHLMVGAVLVWQRHGLGWWLFAFEIMLAISLVVGLRWIRIAFKPNEVARRLADVIASGEFGMRFPVVNQPEIDRVIQAYNHMLQNLQHEWLRLGEQRGFLERFLAVTPSGIVIFDFDNRISLINPGARKLLGLGNDADLTGRQLADVDSRMVPSLATLGINETQMITAANGRRLRCQRAQFTDRGFARSYLLIEELTAELDHSERETYEKLIRMMSHEVTNTVAATNSLLESCRNYSSAFTCNEDRTDYENALDVLIKRNRSLNEFTKGFSDLVKLPEPQREATDIQNLLYSLQTMFAAELKARDIALHVSVEPGLPLLSMDRNQMDQALMNVIRNAAEAIDRDGEITITARLQGGSVALIVDDSGSGLDKEARKNLFKPFFTTKRHGQGLGLTLVREIMTQHGFSFSLEPATIGTRFQLEIPLTRNESHG